MTSPSPAATVSWNTDTPSPPARPPSYSTFSAASTTSPLWSARTCLPTTSTKPLQLWRVEGKPILRVAAEFPATADHYARSRHFWRYQVIPIAGASEGFVPEDADLLIEGTETGKTIAENRLKVIDLLYRSTTCVIGSRDPELSGNRRRVYDELLAALRGKRP